MEAIAIEAAKPETADVFELGAMPVAYIDLGLVAGGVGEVSPY